MSKINVALDTAIFAPHDDGRQRRQQRQQRQRRQEQDHPEACCRYCTSRTISAATRATSTTATTTSTSSAIDYCRVFLRRRRRRSSSLRLSALGGFYSPIPTPTPSPPIFTQRAAINSTDTARWWRVLGRFCPNKQLQCVESLQDRGRYIFFCAVFYDFTAATQQQQQQPQARYIPSLFIFSSNFLLLILVFDGVNDILFLLGHFVF